MFNLCFSFSSVSLIGVNVSWKGVNLFLINVYSLCESRARQILWKEIRDFKRKFSAGEWCVCGDFNAVRNDSERKIKNSMVNRFEMIDLCEFIDGMKVINVPSVGKFTWFNANGSVMSRLDRFLLSEGLIDFGRLRAGRGE